MRSQGSISRRDRGRFRVLARKVPIVAKHSRPILGLPKGLSQYGEDRRDLGWSEVNELPRTQLQRKREKGSKLVEKRSIIQIKTARREVTQFVVNAVDMRKIGWSQPKSTMETGHVPAQIRRSLCCSLCGLLHLPSDGRSIIGSCPCRKELERSENMRQNQKL